jgi:hypothetical protein
MGFLAARDTVDGARAQRREPNRHAVQLAFADCGKRFVAHEPGVHGELAINATLELS